MVGETGVLRADLPVPLLLTTNRTRPDTGSNPSHRGGKPADSRLSYGTPFQHNGAGLSSHIGDLAELSSHIGEFSSLHLPWLGGACLVKCFMATAVTSSGLSLPIQPCNTH
jgi:hypothetical protein